MYRSFFVECLATSLYESSSDMISICGDCESASDKVVQCTGFRGAVRLVGGSPDRCAGWGKLMPGAKCACSSLE